jgi:hypothetical protein
MKFADALGIVAAVALIGLAIILCVGSKWHTENDEEHCGATPAGFTQNCPDSGFVDWAKERQ